MILVIFAFAILMGVGAFPFGIVIALLYYAFTGKVLFQKRFMRRR